MPGLELPADLVLRICASARRDEIVVEAAAVRESMDDAQAVALARLLELIAGLRAESLRDRADEVTFSILERTRYVDLLDFPSEIQRRQAGANIEKFAELVAAYCESDRSGDPRLGGFVEYLEAVEASQGEEAIAAIDSGANAVNLMTVHKSKGLEFTAVFVPGLVEDRFPSRNLGEALPLPPELIVEDIPGRDPRLSEERRLAYVALTRARRYLFLSAAERYEGGKRWKPSRFLADMGFLPAPDGAVVEATAAEPAPLVESPSAPTATQSALPLNHPEVPELLLSYSQLESYRNCPREYQYRHIYRLPTRPSPEQDFGIAVHTALSQILDQNRQGQPPVEEAVAIFDRLFGQERFSDPVNADLWLERGRRFIRDLHRKGRLNGRSLHVDPEQAFSLSLPGFKVRGRIDRIDREERGGYKVIDYKTGDVKQEWELERDLQLGLYAIAAEQVFGLKPVTLAVCYLEDANEVEVLKTTSQLAADQEVAEELAAGIMAGEFSPQPTPWKCRHCDFRLVCDAAM
jgi:DNA helicase-2/ATP-dependent DNA helicase PcrA